MMQIETNDVWKIIKANSFEIANQVIKDVVCIICKNILINACNGPCNCVYCYGCIVNYLNSSKFCPGNTNKCKLEMLSLNENIQFNKIINQKLASIIVKCPRKNCNYQNELKSMGDHLNTCKTQAKIVSSLNNEIRKINKNSENINNALLLKLFSHSKLFIESIEIMKNEIETLNKDVLELRNENKQLKTEVELNKNKSQTMVFALNNKLDEEIKKYGLLKQDLLKVNNSEKKSIENIKVLKSDGEKKELQINELKSKCKQQNLLIETLSEASRQMENLFVTIEQKRQMKEIEIKKEIENFEKKECNLPEFSNKQEEILQKIKNQLTKIKINQEIQTVGEFVWKIDNFKDKLLESKNGNQIWIESDSFYSHKNGYKICLIIYPYGNITSRGTHFSIFYCLSPGLFDDILKWPFKYDVTISVINQNTGLRCNSYTIQYDDLHNHPNRNKPINDRNNGIGFSEFMSLMDLQNIPGLLKNDNLFIKCTVNAS